VAQYAEQVFGVDFQLGKIQRFQFTCRDVWSIRYEALVGWFSMPSWIRLSLWGLLCLRARTVCVAGVAMREDWAGLLLPGGSRRKERCHESVCVLVGVVGGVKYFKYQVYLRICWWDPERCGVQCQDSVGMCSGSSKWWLGVESWCERHNCFTGVFYISKALTSKISWTRSRWTPLIYSTSK
jgi:hypothetical protein